MTAVSATLPEDDADTPSTFVETRSGGLFFLNAVLAGPALIVLVPTVVRGLLRGVGALAGPTPLLDPVPEVAAHAGPWIAWLSVVPLWMVGRNLRMELPRVARWTLVAFAALHTAVLAWWAWRVFG